MPLQTINSNQLSLLKALANCSNILLENKIPEKSIEKVLSIIGNAAQVSRTYVFQNIYENGKLNKVQYQYEWCNSGINSQISNENVNLVEWAPFGNLKDQLAYGEIFTGVVKDIENEELKQILIEQEIVSIVFIPIFSDNNFWGYIGFDDCKYERNWDEAEIITLSAIAANIGLYVHKQELDGVLLKKNNQIEEQKLFFEIIFDNLPVDVVVFNTEHQYLFVNRYAIKNDEIRKWIIGKDDFEYAAYRNKPIEVANKRKTSFEKALHEKKPFFFEESLGNGEAARHHLRYWHPVLNSQNEVIYMIGYGIEITELKQKDYLLEKMASALDKSPVGIALLNQEGNYYYMNKAHAEILEYHVDELIGKSWQTIYEKSEAEKIEEEYFPLLIKNGNWKGITNGITKFKNPIRQEITLTHFDDGGLLCVTRDVGTVMEELEKVQKTNHQLELAMKASNLGRWTYYMESGVLDLNPTIGEILGYSEAELKTFKYLDYINLIHEEDRKSVNDTVIEHVEIFESNKNHIFQSEYRIKKSNGSYIWIMSVGKILKYNDDNIPTEMTGFIIDIDEQKRYDEHIKQSDKRYKELVENLNEIVFTTDLKGNCNFLNSTWTEVMGYSIKETIKNGLIYYVHPEDKNLAAELFQKLLTFKVKSLNNTVRILDINNKIIYLEFKANLQKDINGKLMGVIGTAENVTARIEAEKELEASKEILNKVVSSIDDVIWSFDLENDEMKFISPSIFKLVGFEAVGFYEGTQNWYNFVHPDDVEMLKKSDYQLQNNLIKERDITYRLSFGNPNIIKHIRSQAKLILNNENKPIRIDGVSSDISELIMAEQMLKDSEEKYRLISENIQDVITILDTNGTVYYMSPSATKINGFTEDEFKTKNIFELIHPDDKKLAINFMNDLLLSEKESKLIYRAMMKDGNFHWNESIVTVLEKRGDVTLLQASTRDITERMKAEGELTKALQKEKELNELKSRFVSMASHEFRTPLATIKSSSELIKLFIDKDENQLSPLVYGKVSNKIENILIDIDRITDLMSDILTMGKVEANQIGYNPSPINFSEFITDYIEMEATKIVKNRVLHYKIPENGYLTNIDGKLMHQVLQNLIENALKYSADDKTVELTLMATEKSSIFRVKDYGIGIPANDLQFMYQSFFRASNVENIPGTGLGMAIVKLFVEMHGGTISIESTINVGTTITIEIPNI